ncbi:MAG: hypothetical protein COZ06_02190 [Armatimonadetes bacterium CG_4_10_14_3_um_filter_66_18]|nr:hypothetical protein [Armatimonadota bacterium]PIU93700.1 MAG: hypothetical protein COS65_11550 [Armatimonadetes bacterium CG06_land_8_20_14_3_00_66_21]PIX46591.1 MAG: hypothetical protein COZ57_11215 [Armatimonadetes bacterium CG_4_8_14_3_um_filter_66_20]PIY53111.1 MAG: hypothetical protein COZ06_02190 [Armatimonadetes bacterium CG_4_10_14_3_um_filter_66_18]PIZ49001.1 MAG: hypothetical protein COY42_05045 [Armatimonadetes bacterium CG_4_10_14_0_8_um_filter_66_14]PJB62180.1 MAG: hypothetica
MKFTKRDLGVIGGFAVVLAVACYGYVKKQSTPATGTALRARPTTAGDATTPAAGAAAADRGAPEAKPVALPAREYQEFAVVPERNLFKPLVQNDQRTPPTPSVPPPPKAPPAGPLPPTGAAPPQTPETIAVTGCITVGDVQVALVENVTTKETLMARVGTEAFGYHVASVDETGAVLRKDGQDRYFAFGENKPAQKAEPKTEEKKDQPSPPAPTTPPPSTAPPPPSAPGGFDFRNMTSGQRDEFRRQWEERRRSGGRGG